MHTATKRITTLLMALLLMAGSLWAQERRNITPNQLPPAARQYLRSGLGNFAIHRVTMIVDGFKTQYEVLLVGNTQVIFNRDGGWRTITTDTTLPEEAFPGEIWQYLKDHYFNKLVTRLQRYSDGFQVTVDGKTESFDTRGFHL